MVCSRISQSCAAGIFYLPVQTAAWPHHESCPSLVFVLTALVPMEQSSILSQQSWIFPVARQNLSLLVTAHDCGTMTWYTWRSTNHTYHSYVNGYNRLQIVGSFITRNTSYAHACITPFLLLFFSVQRRTRSSRKTWVEGKLIGAVMWRNVWLYCWCISSANLFVCHFLCVIPKQTNSVPLFCINSSSLLSLMLQTMDFIK